MLNRPLILLLLIFLVSGPITAGKWDASSADGGEDALRAALSIRGEGNASSVAYVLDFFVAQPIEYVMDIEHRVGTDRHEKAIGLLIPHRYLAAETDLFPVNGAQWAPVTEHLYVHEVWNAPDTEAHAEALGISARAAPGSGGAQVPLAWPSAPRGNFAVDAGRYYFIVGGSGTYAYNLTFTGQANVQGPFQMPGPMRASLNEGGFHTVFAAGARAAFLPLGQATLSSHIDLLVSQTSYLFVQLMNDSSNISAKLIRPDGQVEPIFKKWSGGTLVLPGVLTRGGLYQTDLITSDFGTWRLEIAHSGGAGSEAIVYVQPIGFGAAV